MMRSGSITLSVKARDSLLVQNKLSKWKKSKLPPRARYLTRDTFDAKNQLITFHWIQED